MSPNKSPVPKRRKSNRIASQLSKEVDDPSRISNEKSPGVGSSNGNKKKDNKRQLSAISHKNDFKKLKPKPRVGLKSTAKQNTPSSSLLFSSKS